jgi:hypothetical protein
MILRVFSIVGLLSATAGAQGLNPPPPLKPDPAPPPNRIFDNAPRGPSVWQQIQPSVDRSTGRIVDDSTYQIERFQRQRDEEYRRIIPETEFQRFDEERERALRLEERKRVQISEEQARRNELDRREYELRLKAAYPAASGQAAADDQALRKARGKRDEQLIAAQNQRAEALQTRPQDRAQINEEFRQQTERIREEYEKERGRILGVDSAAPTTQPAEPAAPPQ